MIEGYPTNWASQSGAIARAGQLLTLLETMPGKIVMAEVGVYDGRMSQVLLHFRTNLYLYMVDMWAVPYERYRESESRARAMTVESTHQLKRNAELGTMANMDRRAIRQGLSVDIASTFPDGHFDAVFIDADHTREGVAEDLAAWYPKVKAGGLVSGHDYGDDCWGVTEAVDEFFAAMDETASAGVDKVWWVWK